jgi:response regulator RpfG family c-di-GMP phosphodiesterase
MKPKLLLIDDEKVILDSYSEFLEDDFEVHTADNVKNGIKELSSNTYNVAVIDIDFPDAPEGGIDIVNYIEIKELKTRPIILTAKGSIEKFRKVFKKVYDFIEKGNPEQRASYEVLENALKAVKKHDFPEQPHHSYFLSYHRDYAAIADHVELLIRRNKRDVLRDEMTFEAGGDLTDNIKDMINKSDTFIVLWNKNFKNSVWCQNQLEHAYSCQADNKKPYRIILLKLDQTKISIGSRDYLRFLGQERESRELAINQIIERENREFNIF